MGRASRWWKGFLGMKKDRETVSDASLDSSGSLKREKKRWSFSSVNMSRDFDSAAAKAPARVSASDAFWGSDADEEKQKSKQAMAMLAATAAAEAAVAAVKLSGKRRVAGGGKEARAAVKIQSVFRGFLARKALRALKGLVKIQALVRGYLVRKQAATALHRMQTLIRAQETIRFERARRSLDKENSNSIENQVQKVLESDHSKRIPSLFSDELVKCPKILKADRGKFGSRSYKSNVPSSDGIPSSSPRSCPTLPKATTPKSGLRPDWCFSSYDEFRFRFDENTPEFQKERPRAATTPTYKTLRVGHRDGSFHPYCNVPSYMACTKSFKAKQSHQSALKHTSEFGCKKRVPLSEIFASRNAMSGVRMEKSCSNLEDAFE